MNKSYSKMWYDEVNKMKQKEKEKDTTDLITSIILFVIDIIITGLTGAYLWNNILSVILNLRTISFWQSYAISLCLIFFIPRGDRKRAGNDNAEAFAVDIVYTLIIWFIGWLFVCYGVI